MKSGKLITGLVVGIVVALIVIPKTRRMISDAVCELTDSFKDTLDSANDMAQKGAKAIDKFADTTKDVAGAVKSTKQAWE